MNTTSPKALKWTASMLAGGTLLLLAWVLSASQVWPWQRMVPPKADSGVASADLCRVFQVSGDAVGTVGGQPSMSGNGEVVAFWSTANLANENADQNVEIFSKQIAANGVLKQVTKSTGTVFGGFNLAPSFNLSGTYLAFFSDRDLVSPSNTDENFEIFLSINNAITQVTRTDERFANINPVISGDGTTVAFVSNADLDARKNTDGNNEIFVTYFNPSLSTPFTFTQVTNTTGNSISNDFPSISSDGTKLVYVETRRDDNVGSTLGNVSVVKLTELKEGAWHTRTVSPDDGGVYNQARISGNGEFAVYISGTAQSADSVARLYRASLEDNSITRELINSDTTSPNPSQPTLSWDGSRIVFVSQNADSVVLILRDLSPELGQQEFNRFSLGAQSQSALNYGSTNANPVISDDGLTMAWVDGGQVRAFFCPFVITKIGPAGPVLAGDTTVFTVTLTNLSKKSQTPLFTLQDTLVGNLTCSSVDNGECGPPIKWNVSELGANQIVIRTATIKVDAGVMDRTILANHAAAKDEDTTILTSNSVSFTVSVSNNLSIVKTSSRQSVNAAQDFNYEIKVVNQGPSKAYNVTISDTLPAKVNLENTPSGCTSNNKTVTCTNASLEVGGDKAWSVTLPVKAGSGPLGSIINQAQVTSTHHLTPVLSNKVTTTEKPKLKIEQSTNPSASAAVGEPFKFIITLRNTGNVNVTGLTLEDQLTFTSLNGAVPNDFLTVSLDGGLQSTVNNLQYSTPNLDLNVGNHKVFTITVTINNTISTGTYLPITVASNVKLLPEADVNLEQTNNPAYFEVVNTPTPTATAPPTGTPTSTVTPTASPTPTSTATPTTTPTATPTSTSTLSPP